MHPYHRTVTSAPQHTAAAMIDDDMDVDDEYRGDNLTDEEVNDLYENEVCGNKAAFQPRSFNDFMGRVVPGTKSWELSTLEKRADKSKPNRKHNFKLIYRLQSNGFVGKLN